VTDPGMIRLQQFLIVLAGLAAAGVMIALGLWQLGVYQASGNQTAAQRAGATPVPLAVVAPPGTKITDGYGRNVSFAGSYQPDLRRAVRSANGTGDRIIGAIRLDDGRLVAVVRGISAGDPPPVPTGRVEQTGVLMPSGTSDDDTAVPVALLAQTWPGRLVEGYVNLSAADSKAQGLDPAPLQLPSEPGRLRNGAYALQWWLFAGFAVVLAARIARDLQRGRDLDLAEADAAASAPAEHGQESEAPSSTT
jgi:surfeit locus 1 family protein